MAIFARELEPLNYRDTEGCLRALTNHIRILQEQLEYTLRNLDSDNISEIELAKTKVVDADGNRLLYLSADAANDMN